MVLFSPPPAPMQGHKSIHIALYYRFQELHSSLHVATPFLTLHLPTCKSLTMSD